MPAPSTAWVAGFAALVLALGLATVWRRRRKRPAPSAGPPSPVTAPADDPDAMVRLASVVREALVARFGEGWRAKTTEEVADDPEVAEAFGDETADRLVGFLRAADRVKFAGRATEPEPSHHGDGDGGWAPWVAAFVAAAGARSTISGK